MVPSHLVRLDRLPVDSNGKLDRGALPDPDEHADATPKRAPTNKVEMAVAETWRELLGLPELGVDENFFELGGHSLLAVRLINRLQDRFGAVVAIEDLFGAPTVAGLAARIIAAVLDERHARIAPRRIPAVKSAATYTASPSQRRLWFLHHLDETGTAHTIFGGYWLEGPLDVAALRKALALLTQRHESLRTTLVTQGGEPRQRIWEERELPIVERDLSGAKDPAAAARSAAAVVAEESLDLAAGPLARLHLLRTGPERHLLVLSVHHIISDGWSMQVLLEEVAEAYAAFRQGTQPALPDLPCQIKDIAAWQADWMAGADARKQADYWRDKLADCSAPLALPTDAPRPARKGYRGASANIEIEAPVAAALRSLARDRRVSLFTVLVTLVKVLLHRICAQDDISVGTPVAGRNHPDLERQIGFLANTVVLRDEVRSADRFDALLTDVGAHGCRCPRTPGLSIRRPGERFGRWPRCQPIAAL